jgi:hypothetical protein
MSASPPRPESRATSDFTDPIATALRVLRIFILLAVAAWMVAWLRYASGAAAFPRSGQGRKFGGPDAAGAGSLVQAIPMSGDNEPGPGAFAAGVGYGGTGRTDPATSRIGSSWRDVRLPHYFPFARRLPLDLSRSRLAATRTDLL